MLTLKELMTQALQNSANCDNTQNPLNPVFELFRGKWKNQVLFEIIALKNARFGQLAKAISTITNTMLSSTLCELEKDGLITRTQFNEIPPHVEYAITTKGQDLLAVYYEMYKWSVKYNLN
ncbi:winged helix-turn-helix transcriptional regulator [Loigolactobacillus coryniformis]|uniref:Helix-turn-helix transcriptional regulator n=1 Tax=Loigolactobacillus coryniformis TaxID=1610 RepID=A0A5B8THH9_9LACO|nr:helix-turn-helix domain-containing protein [Loigolactobacillus coryniformis]QEA53937.1 helix-turn-helix transcriptional regulator [Loigolactobacillus coryniformis]RRG07274.1 MAG: transcriptional regulator [Lactobacillus sp.]